MPNIVAKPFEQMTREELLANMYALNNAVNTRGADIERLKESIRTIYTRLEGLYRIIYGVAKLGESITGNSEYVAQRYLEDSRPLMANCDGWTGRKCPVCAGKSFLNDDFQDTCVDCGGTGNENIFGFVRINDVFLRSI